jgi:hypothetical protein
MNKAALKIGVWVLALSAAGCRDREPAASPADRASGQAVVDTATATGDPAGPWEAGWQGVYRVTMSSRLQDASGHLLLGLSLEGDLHVAVQRVLGPRVALSLAFTAPQVSLEGDDPARTAAQAASLRSELALPFVGTFENGVLSSMGFGKGASAFAVGVRRTVLSLLQTPPAQGGQAVTESREFDANGQVRVRYTQTGEGLWQAEKQAYLRGLYESDDDDPERRSPRPALESATGMLSVQGGRLARAERSDVVRVDLMGTGGMRSHTAGTLVLNPGAPPPASALLSLDASAMTVLSAGSPWRTPLDIGAMDSARMEGLDFDTVLKALVARAKDPRRRGLWAKKNEAAVDAAQVKDATEWTHDWSRYFTALPAFFRQQPQTLKRAEKEIRKGSPAATSLIGGLSSSGVAAAQQILLALARDEKLDAGLREAALRNLAQCNLPTVETAEAMRAMFTDEFSKRYAVYGTGIISRKLRESGEDAAALAGVNWLLSLLEGETDVPARRDILRGLANAGHPVVLPSMGKLLTSDVASDRAGALEALRLVDDPAVDALIAQRLNPKAEPERAVREAAVQAASTRSPAVPLRQAVIDAAQTDPEKRVKTLAMKLLRQWVSNDPSLQPIIDSIASATTGNALTP